MNETQQRWLREMSVGWARVYRRGRGVLWMPSLADRDLIDASRRLRNTQ